MESLCDSTIIEVVPWFGTVAGAIVFIIIMGLYNSIFFSLEKNEPVSYAKILGGQKKEELEQALPGFGINFIAHIPVFFRFMSYIFFNKDSEIATKYIKIFLFLYVLLFFTWGLSFFLIVYSRFICK